MAMSCITFVVVLCHFILFQTNIAEKGVVRNFCILNYKSHVLVGLNWKVCNLGCHEPKSLLYYVPVVIFICYVHIYGCQIYVAIFKFASPEMPLANWQSATSNVI